MIITFILSLIGIFGTLTILAYLRQVEDKMPELLRQMEEPECQVCHLPHPHRRPKKMRHSLGKIKRYYRRKRNASLLRRRYTKQA
ncbi:hypothetical protein C8N40_11257 [Pontibacter mucosus]|uniref:Uncharacterized protein n=2 Tax=Pontibacter TaxID=323449 RepID=A0A1I2XPI9_9BACT|nr:MULTISPECIES: hypothetical protein [Pontibacter]PTX14210.1 hypothetical protein C8N40_11257 [Pontibacter mucosus]SFH15027.1 hypothetical protein SAMN05421739_106154 [Pontibacter chinhatensis]